MAWGPVTLVPRRTNVLPHRQAGPAGHGGARSASAATPSTWARCWSSSGLAQATDNIWLAIVAPLFAHRRARARHPARGAASGGALRRGPISTTRAAPGAGSEGADQHDERSDEREEEREFLADLEARTGRDLADWMAAIAAQGFADKNDTIDWLRAQGFPFARASWLERIHSNGGKPDLCTAPTAAGREHAAPARAKPAPVPQPGPTDLRRGASRQPRQAAGGGQGLPAALPAAGGGDPRRPARRRRRAEGRPTSRSARPREFAAVTLHATELRLGLDLGDRAFDAQLQKPQHEGARAAPSRTWWC